jgi:uncharacterized SAM-binding protein YcdF (DUF218 family)
MFYPISKAFWPLFAPSNLVILITAAAAVFALLLQSKFAAWLAAIGGCTLVIGGFTPVSYSLLRPLQNRFPQWQAGFQPLVDGVIVLGGSGGAIELVELGQDFPQARLVYSGLSGDTIVDHLLAEFARFGGDRERVTVETRSRNTFENALYAKELIKPNAQERWLVVTMASHMPRAIGCFQRVGFKVEAYPIRYMTPVISFRFSSSALSLLTLDMAIKEWIGLLVYRATGKTDELFPAPRPVRAAE